MDVFFARDSFVGPSIDVCPFGGPFVSQAKFNGWVLFANWLRRDVEALLPPELELADNVSVFRDLHPVVFLFGEVTEGATIFGGITFPLGVSYHEFGLAIPFVKHRRGRHLHTFVPRMYSSFFPATWAGNQYYGFSKATATMRWEGPLFVITALDGALLLHAAVEPAGDWVAGSRCDLPNFSGMRSVSALPVVGRKHDGTCVGSYFGWDFTVARVRPARAALSIDAGLVEGLTPRCCSTLPSGTFEVQRMIWRLSWPEPWRPL